jgi:hypothetical protein
LRTRAHPRATAAAKPEATDEGPKNPTSAECDRIRCGIHCQKAERARQQPPNLCHTDPPRDCNRVLRESICTDRTPGPAVLPQHRLNGAQWEEGCAGDAYAPTATQAPLFCSRMGFVTSLPNAVEFGHSLQ